MADLAEWQTPRSTAYVIHSMGTPMSKVEYRLTKDDLLQLYLFRSTHLGLNHRLRRRNRLVFPVAYLALAACLCFSRQYTMAILFALLAVAWFALSPVLLKRRLRKYYEKYIAENCGELLAHPLTVEPRPEGLHLSSFAGESTCHYSAIDSIAEDHAHTYIFIGKDATVVFPHNKLPRDTIDSIISEIEKRRGRKEELAESPR